MSTYLYMLKILMLKCLTVFFYLTGLNIFFFLRLYEGWIGTHYSVWRIKLRRSQFEGQNWRTTFKDHIDIPKEKDKMLDAMAQRKAKGV